MQWAYLGSINFDSPRVLDAAVLLVYFTHPYWGGEEIDTMAPDPKVRLSHVRAAVLEVHDGNLVCTEH
ncbi:hypothetical protein [Pseudarthrobacter sp. NamB4]|uniref:hypothetical protein n=1 Tax=Pseudarthrobacter sp. NamB4 TaxID=2576837 RepID=UPI001F105047|nr:hypothetical protein [Pseudarthrobacter sp. NamB4]